MKVTVSYWLFLCVCWFAETDDVLVSSGEVSVEGSSQLDKEEEEEENSGKGKRERKRKRETNPTALLKGAKYGKFCDRFCRLTQSNKPSSSSLVPTLYHYQHHSKEEKAGQGLITRLKFWTNADSCMLSAGPFVRYPPRGSGGGPACRKSCLCQSFRERSSHTDMRPFSREPRREVDYQ